jgi:AmmeMemoRadiSam system protein B
MSTVRRAAVDGLFYPSDHDALAGLVDHLLAGVAATPTAATPPVALIAPHAGYVYSGPVAATAYAGLAPWRDEIRRVVVVGPAHRVAVRGLALSSADAFATPLGTVDLDHAACMTLLDHPCVRVDDAAHAPEHSIEVQIPFLQRVLGDGWLLVPVLAGSAPAGVVADALAPLWGTAGTLVVVSTDLSHYYDLATARQLDQATAATIVAAAWEQLGVDDACGAVPVRGALELVRRRGQHVDLLDLRTSADTAGPPDRVVGYGSFVVR